MHNPTCPIYPSIAQESHINNLPGSKQKTPIVNHYSARNPPMPSLPFLPLNSPRAADSLSSIALAIDLPLGGGIWPISVDDAARRSLSRVLGGACVTLSEVRYQKDAMTRRAPPPIGSLERCQ